MMQKELWIACCRLWYCEDGAKRYEQEKLGGVELWLRATCTPLSERLEQAIGIKKISMLANVILSIFLPHALRHLRTSKVFWYHVNIFLKTTFAFEDYENEIFSLLSSARACDSTLFWREDAIAVVILLRVLAKMLSDIRRLESFVILRSREGLTSFNKNNHVNFSGEKKKNTGVSMFLTIREKIL